VAKDFDYIVFVKTVEEEREVLNEISILNQSDVDRNYQIKWHGIQTIDTQGCYSRINVRGNFESYELFLKSGKYHVEIVERSN
jgi:hypothetical protein